MRWPFYTRARARTHAPERPELSLGKPSVAVRPSLWLWCGGSLRGSARRDYVGSEASRREPEARTRPHAAPDRPTASCAPSGGATARPDPPRAHRSRRASGLRRRLRFGATSRPQLRSTRTSGLEVGSPGPGAGRPEPPEDRRGVFGKTRGALGTDVRSARRPSERPSGSTRRHAGKEAGGQGTSYRRVPLPAAEEATPA